MSNHTDKLFIAFKLKQHLMNEQNTKFSFRTSFYYKQVWNVIPLIWSTTLGGASLFHKPNMKISHTTTKTTHNQTL